METSYLNPCHLCQSLYLSIPPQPQIPHVRPLAWWKKDILCIGWNWDNTCGLSHHSESGFKVSQTLSWLTWSMVFLCARYIYIYVISLVSHMERCLCLTYVSLLVCVGLLIRSCHPKLSLAVISNGFLQFSSATGSHWWAVCYFLIYILDSDVWIIHKPISHAIWSYIKRGLSWNH